MWATCLDSRLAIPLSNTEKAERKTPTDLTHCKHLCCRLTDRGPSVWSLPDSAAEQHLTNLGGGSMVRHLLSDVRYALRGLLPHPAFRSAAVLTRAGGIGRTTTIFGVGNGILLRPLSFPNAHPPGTICELE